MNNKNVVSIGVGINGGKNLSVLTDGEIEMIGGGVGPAVVAFGVVIGVGVAMYIAGEIMGNRPLAIVGEMAMEFGCEESGGGPLCRAIGLLPTPEKQVLRG